VYLNLNRTKFRYTHVYAEFGDPSSPQLRRKAMQTPTMIGAETVAPDTISLTSYCPLPGLGMLPVNAFVIKAAQPVLVDTGLAALRAPFLEALTRSIDPSELRWIWLSHMDADHLGNLDEVLALAPQAKVITNYLGMGKLGLRGFDVSRVHLLEPGARIDAGDRVLQPLRPAYYDAPETMGFFDTRTRVLFCADAFGTLMQAPEQDAAAIAPQALADGMLTWAAIDAPWLGMLDRAVFGQSLNAIERLDPAAIISGHLPVARGITRQLTGDLDRALAAGRIAAPDHAEIERLITGHDAAA
jgi:glyoxylase-like metal-dependent hydrolase (beta-lactamase superfamily II)